MNTYEIPAPRRSVVGRAEDWLDARGRGAWIAAMVLGFFVFWPVGLALALYITYTNRWSKNAMFGKFKCNSGKMARFGFNAMRPSGNAAFDAYKADTLRRLEDEQEAFESFLKRLRDAKDKQEFDTFMDERSKEARVPQTVDSNASNSY